MSKVLAHRPDGTSIGSRYEQRDGYGVAEIILDRVLPAGEATLIFDYDAPFTTRGIDGLAKLVEAGRTDTTNRYARRGCRPAIAINGSPVGCLTWPGIVICLRFEGWSNVSRWTQ